MDGVRIGQATTEILEAPRKGRNKTVWLERLIQIALSFFCILLISLLIFLLFPNIQDIYLFTFKPFLTRYWPNMVATVVLLVIGFSLYTLRGYQRLLFGSLQILLGSGLGWYAINKAYADTVYDAIVILIVALYLMGRGWINIATEVPSLQINRES